MPVSYSRTPCTFDKTVNPPRFLDVPLLRGNHENRVDPRQRDDPHKAGKRTSVLAPERVLQRRGEILDVPARDREQRIRLPREDVDVESPYQPDQTLPRSGLPGNEQSVPTWISGNFATFADVGLHDLGEILGRRVLQWNNHRPRRARVAGRRGGRL
jgi:hypothetical protein